MKAFIFFFLVMINIAVNCVVGQIDPQHEARLIYDYKNEENKEKKYLNLLKLANYYQQTHIHKADSIVPKLLKESNKQNDYIRLSALLFKAKMLERRGDIPSYIATIKQASLFKDKVGDTMINLELYKHIGWSAHLAKNDSIALHYLDFYLKEAQKLSIQHYVVEAYLLLSRYYTIRRNEKKSSECVQKAFENVYELKNPAILAACYHFKAKISEAFEYIDMGVENGIFALQNAMKTNSNSLIIIILVESGLAEVRFKNFNEAEVFLQQAIDRALAIHDDVGRAWARIGMAGVHLGRNQLFEALFNAKRALAVCKQKNCTQGIADAYSTLATVYKQKNEFDLAIKYYKNALSYYQKTNYYQKIVDIYHSIGLVLYAQGDFQETLYYFKKAISFAKKYRINSQEFNVYRSMADVYQRLHNYKQASYYQQEYIDYMERSNILKIMNRATELNEKYKAQQRNEHLLKQRDSIEYERKEKEIAIAQLENSKLRNNFQTYVILGFFVIVFLVSVILYERYRQQKQMILQREIEIHLSVLRTQMNPHFIFNTISVIQSFLYENNVEKSSQILVKFSRLIRLILENSTKKMIHIETEENILTHYLQTQQQRFDNKFTFNIFIAEELKNEQAMIPPIITQPFVENAIEHGQLHNLPKQGVINIRFEKTTIYHILNNPHAPTTLLEVTIEDNGIGIDEGRRFNKKKDHRSMALDITRERIKYLNMKYRTSGYVKIEDKSQYNEDEMGTKVILMLPYIKNRSV